MKRGLIFLALAAGLPVSLEAAPSLAPKPKPKPAATTPAKPAAPLALTPGTRRVVLSPEGNAIAAKLMGAPDPRMAQIRAEIATLKQEQLKLIGGPTVDVDKLEPLFRREEVLQTEVRTRTVDRMLSLLRALSDPDRVSLLQSLAKPALPQNSKPAQPPASAPASPQR